MWFTSWEISTRKYVAYVIRINNHYHSVEYPGAMICCNLRWLVITVASMCDVCRYTQIKTLLMMILAWHTALAENQSDSHFQWSNYTNWQTYRSVWRKLKPERNRRAAIYGFSLTVTKKKMQALCQVTPTDKLTDPYDIN